MGLLLFTDAFAADPASGGPATAQPKTRHVSSRQIRTAVAQYIQQNAPWRKDQLKIRHIKFDQSLAVPAGKIALTVKPPKHTDWLGPVLFTVRVMVNGAVAKKVTVPANIEAWNDVALTAKPLGKYQTIEKKHIRIKKMNLARVPANAVLTVDQAVGARTVRSIAANTILRSNQIESPPVVERGDVVQVVAESKHMKISIQALAREDGARGDVIRVKNLRSKKTIYAKVVDGRTVQVEF
jgi:flagella basal body P-ring formation protein FlgA